MTVSAGLPAGPSIPAWTPPATYLDRLEALEAGFVSVRAYGAYGLGLVDETTQLQAALTAAAGQILLVPDGIYLHGTLTVNPNTRVLCTPGAVFKPSGADHAVKFYTPTARTPATTYPLTANTTRDTYTLTVSAANSANFAAGNMVNIRDASTLGGVVNHRESNIVRSVDTGTGVITFEEPLDHAYLTASTATIAKVTPAQNIHWFGGQFDMSLIGTGANDRDCIYSDWALDCTVSNVTGYNHPNKVVAFHGAINSHPTFVGGRAPSAVAGGQGYVGQLENARNCSLRSTWGRNCRHVADITAGSDNLIDGVVATGRTASSTTAAFLHGLESRRCRVVNVFAENVDAGFAAGNGFFGADYDFEAEGIHALGCTDGVWISQGCTGWKVAGRAVACTGRGIVTEGNSDGEVDFSCDGCGTAASGYGSAHFAASTIRGKVKVRNAKDRSVGFGTGDYDLDLNVDHPATGHTLAIQASSLDAASVLRLRGPVKVNDATHDAVSVTGPAGAVVRVGCELTGTGRFGVRLAGGATDQFVSGNVRGAFTSQVRSEAGEVVVDDILLAASGNCVDGGAATSRITLGPGVRFAGTGNVRLTGTAGATIVGGQHVQNGNPEYAAPSADAAFTLSPRTSAKHTIHTGTLTANRAVSLNTVEAQNGVRFRLTRTGGGAFTLDVGVGPLKSLSTNQWAEFMHNGTAYVLVAFGSL